jgi:probable rRNA maturation factor
VDLWIPASKPQPISRIELYKLFNIWKNHINQSLDGSIILQFVSSDEMVKLAKQHTNKRSATDVLSFNYNPPLQDESGEIIAGEIVICREIAISNAKKLKVSQKNEYATLFVHGLLHLAGRDHDDFAERDRFIEDTRAIMEQGGFTTVSLW